MNLPFPPAHAAMPENVLVSPADEIRNAAPHVARAAFDKPGGPKEWVDVEGGHFGLLYYPSEEFDRASSAQAAFLKQHPGHLWK